MLIIKLDRIHECYKDYPHLEDAVNCLREHWNDPAPSTLYFPGGYLMLQENTTKPIEEGDLEAHLKYLDIQVLMEGSEAFIWTDIAGLPCTQPYNEKKDKIMYAGTGCTMIADAGTCYFFAPADAHKPGCHIHTPNTYRKAVIKLEL